MSLSTYREVWNVPAARSVLLLGMLLRLPLFGGMVLLTVHVVERLDPRYTAAGLVATAGTIAVALAGPWRGRLLDRVGLRRTIAPSLVVLPLCWVIAPFSPYWLLLTLVVVAGLFSVPSFSIIRQGVVAAVSDAQRKTALALDSVLVEISFMAGPALAVWLASLWGTAWTLMAFELTSVAAAGALFLANPQMRHENGDDDTPGRAPMRSWLTPGVVALMLMAAATTLVLGATDLSVVAGLRDLGHPGSIGWVLALWGLGSAVGGFLLGATARAIPTWSLVLGLGAATTPVAFARSDLAMALLLVVAGLFCAPSIAAATEELSVLVPSGARGEAFGWHGSMMTVGSAAGAPAIGLAIDGWGWPAGFLVGGLAGVLVAALGAAVGRRRVRPTAAEGGRT